jgi:tetratricopeptide (TPR) repeat protein
MADKLLQAEALMNEYPDSALNLLKGIAQTGLQTQEHRARYALLYSQALDKNFIDLTSDSLINIAVDYYKDRDDVRAKFLSYYYLGRIYTNANNLTQATLAYMEAEQLVDELDDDYAAGLLYEQIGLIYRSYYDFPKSLQAYQQAIEHYTKANRPFHKIYNMFSASDIYRNTQKEDAAYQTLKTALAESRKLNDQSLVKSCINNLILVCIDLERWEEATQWYQEYQKNNSRNYPTVAFYGYIARLHAKNKNFKDAFMLLNETWKKTKSLQDSINLFHAESQVHQMNGSWEESYRSMAKSISHQNKVIRKSLQQPVLTAQNNFLNQELEHKEYRLRMEKYVRLLGFVILLLVSVIVITFLRKRFQKRLKEQHTLHEKKMEALQQGALKREQSLRAYTAELESKSSLSGQDVLRLTQELENSQKHIEEARNFIEQTNQEMESLKADKHEALIRINKTLKNHFKQIENTFQVLQMKYKNAENKDYVINKYIQNTIAEFYGSEKADRNLEELVNELYGDAMSQLRKEMNFPSEDHYRLACLLLAGLSINFIAALSGETSNALYKRRYKIREIMSKAKDSCKDIAAFI